MPIVKAKMAEDNETVELRAKNATEITADVAIQFAKFCNDCCTFYFKEFKWQIGTLEYKGRLFTSEELFEEFINKHYEHTNRNYSSTH
jgi:hypothetical protein